MINAHMASKAASAQTKADISRPGMVTFWILFATISLVVSITLGIAITSIPSKVPLTQRDRVWQLRDVARDSLAPASASELGSVQAPFVDTPDLLSANTIDIR